MTFLQRGLFLRIQVDPNLIGNGSRHVALERQGVPQFTLIALGPQVPVRGTLDQLRGDADLVAGTQDGAFHDGVHVQLTSDLRQRLPRVFVRHHRRARDHAQRADLAEVRNQLVGHPVGEVVLRRIAREALQWQDSQGPNDR